MAHNTFTEEELNSLKALHSLGNANRQRITPSDTFPSMNIGDIDIISVDDGALWYLEVEFLDHTFSTKGGVYLNVQVSGAFKKRGPVLSLRYEEERKVISVFFERLRDKKWYAMEMPANTYSLRDNINAKHIKNMIAFGFLLMKFNAKKSLLSYEQIIGGFEMVMKVLHKDKLLQCRSFVMYQSMEKRKLNHLPLPPEIVFSPDFWIGIADTWCDQQLQVVDPAANPGAGEEVNPGAGEEANPKPLQ